MSRGLSSAAKAELYAANTGGVWLALVTITHDDFAATIRLVNDRQNVTSNGQVFTACAFSLTLPPDADTAPRAVLSIDNVDRSIVASVRAITSPATVRVDVIRRSAPDTLIISYPYLRAVSATISSDRIDFTVAGDRVLDESYPGQEFTPLAFPAGFSR